MTPTNEDMARNARADLEACDAVTPGPLRSQWGNTAPLPHKVWAGPGIIARFWQQADAVFFTLARAALPAWVCRARHAEAFKDFVHAYLSAHGVPEGDPANRHQQEGCRIGARLDLLLAERDALAARVAELEAPAAAVTESRDALERKMWTR